VRHEDVHNSLSFRAKRGISPWKKQPCEIPRFARNDRLNGLSAPVVEAIPPSHREKANDPEDDNRRNHEDQNTIPEGGDAPSAGCRSRVVTQSTTLSQNWMRDGEARHDNR
jgi:hypothetical protein